MGYNIGAKGVAIGLLALAHGDKARAKRVWSRLRFQDPGGVDEALDMVEDAIRQEQGD
jgi:hypothetical protein